MSGNEIIDLDLEATKKFKEKFSLPEDGVFSYRVNNIENLPEFFDMQFEQYDVNIRIHKIDFQFIITASKYEKNLPIRKLKIKTLDFRLQDELIEGINHLQRRRDIVYALHVLTTYSHLHEQRESIWLIMLDKLGNYVSLVHNNNEGYYLMCKDERNDCFYFKAIWKLYWNTITFDFCDFLDFSVNRENNHFHVNAKPYMQILIKPMRNFDVKKELWTDIALLVNESIQMQIAPVIKTEDNIEGINSTIDITDSDNEDDVIVVET